MKWDEICTTETRVKDFIVFNIPCGFETAPSFHMRLRNLLKNASFDKARDELGKIVMEVNVIRLNFVSNK
jgi:hypothetical protein